MGKRITKTMLRTLIRKYETTPDRLGKRFVMAAIKKWHIDTEREAGRSMGWSVH